MRPAIIILISLICFDALSQDVLIKKNTNGDPIIEINSVNQNVFVGDSTGLSNNGYQNTSLGFRSLFANTVGYKNTAVGFNALSINTTGELNSAFGTNALKSNTIGYNNTAIGESALSNNIWGTANTAIGRESLEYNTTGSNNTATGYYSLVSNSIGYDNSAFGRFSLGSNNTGFHNTALGSFSLASNTTGSNNTAIGASANVSNGTLTNATAIGSKAYVASNNSLVLGSISGLNGASTQTRVGIGTSAPHPNAILHIQSTERGILFPTMNTAQRDAIIDPPHGLHIFNLDEVCLSFYDATYQVWNCYCDHCKTIVIRITQDTSSIEFNNYAIYHPAQSYVIVVDSNVTIQSDSTEAALDFTGMIPGTTIRVINHGTIESGGGKGGAGAVQPGCGNSAHSGGNGNPGGHAISTIAGVVVSVDNYGIIAGGGGGGGGSSANPSGYGGGGGGGAGIPGGSGGMGGGIWTLFPFTSFCGAVEIHGAPGGPGTMTDGGQGGAGSDGGANGGDGGDRGQAGQNGTGTIPGAGGSPGKAISGGSGNQIINYGSGQTYGVVD